MTSPYAFIADLEQQIPEIPTDSIVSRTIHNDDGVNVILFGFAAGQELSEHTAAMPAMLYFVQGEADLTLGDDEPRTTSCVCKNAGELLITPFFESRFTSHHSGDWRDCCLPTIT